MSSFEFQSDAQNYDAAAIKELFVPNRVWGTLRNPAKHKILYGVPGCGKTIALKRISWPAMSLRPDFRDNMEFAAFYCDLQELEQLKAAISSPALARDDPGGKCLRGIVEYFSLLHILSSIAEDLEIASTVQAGGAQQALENAFLSVVDRTKIGAFSSVRSALDSLLDLKDNFIDTLYDIGSLDDLRDITGSLWSPERLLYSFHLGFKKARLKLKMAILLDQYEVLPGDFQKVFNPLLKRESEALYYTVVGCVPFSFDPSLDERELKPNIDFKLASCEYFPNDRKEYIELLKYIWDRLRRDGPEPRSVLQGGVEYLSVASSRSVRRFLELCEDCGALRAQPREVVTHGQQKDAVRRAAVDFREALEGAAEVKRGSLWRLIELLADKNRKLDQKNRNRIAGTIVLSEPALVGPPKLTAEVTVLLKKGFEEGAFLFDGPGDVHFTSLPDRWLMAPLLGVFAEAEVDPRIDAILTSGEAAKLTSPGRSSSKTKDLGPLGKIKRVFLSMSFKSIAQQEAAERGFKKVFEELGIAIVIGKSAGAAMINEITESIQETDITVLDATHLSPNIVLEMGITYGLGHRLYPIAEADNKGNITFDGFLFLLNVGIADYRLAENSLRNTRDVILKKCVSSITPAQMLMVSAIRNVKIRVNQGKRRSLCVYYPSERRELWQSSLGAIQNIADSRGYIVRVVDLKPHPKSSSILDNLVWSICKSDRVLVDTTGSDGPDLYGALALGFAAGLNKAGYNKEIRRLEEHGRTYGKSLGMWPGSHTISWSKQEDILNILDQFLPSTRK